MITTNSYFFVLCLLLLLNCECDVLRVLARIVPVMKFFEDIVLFLPTPEEMTVGPFIRGKIRRVLHKLNKTRTFRINGTFRLK